MKEYYCEYCEEELDADELEWKNSTPVCPQCEREIEL